MPSLVYNIGKIGVDRHDQSSFHVASEDFVRIQFHNLKSKEFWGPMLYEGDIVLTVCAGSFELLVNDKEITMTKMEQIVINAGETLKVVCIGDGTIQFIWTPPFAKHTMITSSSTPI